MGEAVKAKAQRGEAVQDLFGPFILGLYLKCFRPFI